MLMLRSEVRADGQTLEPQGVGERAELVGDGAERGLGVGKMTFIASFGWSRLGGPWRSFSEPTHFAGEETEN